MKAYVTSSSQLLRCAVLVMSMRGNTPSGIEEAVAAKKGVAVDEDAAEAPGKGLRQVRRPIRGQRVLPLPH